MKPRSVTSLLPLDGKHGLPTPHCPDVLVVKGGVISDLKKVVLHAWLIFVAEPLIVEPAEHVALFCC